ncbi:MAG: TlpA family protein disulfide reductase [Prevotella sp.]|nr:TlpA family protein disulfide reductase [Prevotella sp.]
MKKIIHSVIILLLIQGFVPCTAQCKTINIFFPDSGSEKKIILCHSIIDLKNYFYEPNIQKYKTTKDQISIIIPDSILFSTMKVESTPEYVWGSHVCLYLNRGETLNIFLDSVHRPVFEGKPSKLHSLLFDLKYGGGFQRSELTLNNFLQDTATLSFYDYIKKSIDFDISNLNSLHDDREIDEVTCLFVKNLIIDEYLYRIGMTATDRKAEYAVKMDNIRFHSDVNRLYIEYPVTFNSGIHYGNKAELKELGLIPGEKSDLGYHYDDEVSYYIYLNRQEQEHSIASQIIGRLSTGAYRDASQLERSCKKFKQIFPNSIYNSILDNLETSRPDKAYSLVYYSIESGFREYGKYETDNLSTVIQKFIGKPVLVDFWAGWCGPCLREFGHLDKLNKFLIDNHIGKLFVSVDYANTYDKWREIIQEKKLEGFHYFMTDTAHRLPYFKTDAGIPRYMLFNEKGENLMNKGENPSSGKLIPQIQQVLGLKHEK